MTHLSLRIGLVAFTMAVTSLDAAAGSVLCDTIQRSDTVTALARRLRGRAESIRQAWFRIVDRERSRAAPKADDDAILSGWRICIPEAQMRAGEAAFTPAGANGRASPQAAAEESVPEAAVSGNRPLELVFIVVGPIVFGAAIGLGWHTLHRCTTNRQLLRAEVEGFGELFIRDFERPLVVAGVVARPIRARLRWASRHRRLDILLAPADGHRYPNLADHRQNVEYDVDRIAHRLR